MMEWKDVKLGDILQEKGYIRGPFGSALKRGEMKSDGIPVYEQQHAIYDSRFFRFYIGNEKFEELKRFQVKTNDLIISCSGTVGEISIIKDEDPKGIISQALLTLRVDQGQILPKFLYYFFKTKKGHNSILERSSGSVQVNIAKRNVIEDIRLLLPPLSTQRRIASILSSLDRKIELNNKINAQLEEMAQAIFKSWFVDFEPFKDGKFVESELGMIPEGWRVECIKDIPHKIETGRRPKGGVGTITKGIPSIGAEHVKGMGNFDYGKVKFIPEEYASSLKSGKVDGYELLIYKDGGKPGYFIPNYSIFGEGYPYETCYLNEHVFKLDFEAGRWYNIFSYFYFQTDYVMNYLNAQGGKAAIPGINKNDVESLLIYTPDNKKVQEFGKLVLPFFTTMLKNLKANRELSQLRDTLLPKLMNGEIEI